MVQMVHPARQPSIAHRNPASPTPLRRAKPNTLNTACFAGVFVSQRGRNVAENQAGEENLKLEFQTQAGGENLKLEFQTQAGGENLSELHELLLGQWFDASLYPCRMEWNRRVIALYGNGGARGWVIAHLFSKPSREALLETLPPARRLREREAPGQARVHEESLPGDQA